MRDRRHRIHRAAPPAVLIAALALAACSSPRAVPPTTTTTPTVTSGSSTTSTVALAATCSPGVLQLSENAGGTSAGTTYDVLSVTNAGPSACSLDGYPTVTFFGASPSGGVGAGPKLTLGEDHGGPSPAPVTIKAKGTAEFLLVFSDVPVDGQGCVTVASVEVQTPGSTEAISAPATLSPCGPDVKVYPFAAPGSENP